MKILIAEDDTVSRRILEAWLAKWGYDVSVACDGKEAWESLRSGDPPDLVILDIMMPEIDGIEVCRRIRKKPALRDIPVLFISALAETEDKLKAFKAGGVDYITKPFAEKEVLARVRTHLSLASARKELLRINLDLSMEIEERKTAEETLRNTEMKYRAVVEEQTEAISRFRPDGTLTFVNEVFCRTFGKKAWELIGSRWQPEAALEDLPLVAEKLHSISTANPIVTIENRVFSGTGELRWMQFVNRGLFDDNGHLLEIQSIGRDITEYKRVEQLNSHLASIVKCSDDAIITKSLDGAITSWNGGAERIYGYSAAEITGRSVSLLIPPELSDEFHSFLEKARRGEPIYRHETVRLRKDGRRIDVSLSISPIRDNQGEIVEISTIARDISEKKRAEEELLKMIAYNRSLIDSSLDPLVTIGPDGLITDANIATTEVTGRKWGELIGSDFSEYFTDQDSARSGYRKVFREGYVRDYPLDIRHRDGHTIPVLYNASVYRDPEGEVMGVFAAARDITALKRAEEHRKKLEEQLQQAQKMEAIGLLAGSIAHDFNNILTAIIGYSDLIIMSSDADSSLLQYGEEIYAAAERAAELTHGLLAFSRKQVMQMRPLDICSVVREVERMLVRLVPEDITYKTKVFDKDLIAMADKGQIVQVLMNLVTNAKDAMPKGGTLEIETFPIILEERFVKDHGFGEPGKYACISVRDSGSGMDEETRKRIFEPFFTTKEAGKGTGLGMSIVYGIVKQHNGYITVDSEPGEGTTFKIYLTLIGDTSDSMGAAERMKPSPEGRETILLVEDDEHVRTIQKIVLENAGYTVITAVDGRDAIDKFTEHQAEVAILITDVVMPKIGGKQLSEEIKKVRPDLKVLFLSGYAKGIEIERDIPEDEFNFMPKPVVPSELLKKVREILDSV